MSGAAVLSVNRLCKSFGDFQAVADVDLQVGAREIHALIGPNGAGKSTLLNLISGHLTPSSGDVSYLGRRISGQPPHETVRRGIARSFQITSIFPGYTALQNVQLALLAREGHCTRLFRPAAGLLEDEAHGWLRQVQLDAAAQRVGGELAAGDRKRLEFAIALASRPKLLLLDEPTAGMSPGERALVIELLRAINTEHGVAVLFTEHDIEMVFAIAQRITVLHQGRCITTGTPQAVRADPRVQDIYLGETLDDAELH